MISLQPSPMRALKSMMALRNMQSWPMPMRGSRAAVPGVSQWLAPMTIVRSITEPGAHDGADADDRVGDAAAGEDAPLAEDRATCTKHSLTLVPGRKRGWV